MIITDLATRLKVSTTPVREALSRLAGEDLVADDPVRGYHAHTLGIGEIEELFELHHAYVRAALRSAGVRAPRPSVLDKVVPATVSSTPEGRRARAEAFFDRLVRAGDNQVMVRAHAALADRLAPIRLIEPAVLEQIDGEIADLEARFEDGDTVQLTFLLDVYHNRRIASSKLLLSAVRTHQIYDQYSLQIP
jgi:DNA-binding GntR family transcriptional regulator